MLPRTTEKEKRREKEKSPKNISKKGEKQRSENASAVPSHAHQVAGKKKKTDVQSLLYVLS